MTTTTAVNVPDLIDQQKVGSFQIRVLILCALAAMLDGFAAQMIGYLAPSLKRDMNLDPAALTRIFAWGLVGLMLGALTLGPVADRFGRKPVIVTCTLFFGLLTLATAFAHSANSLTVLRFLASMGFGGTMPNAIALTAEYAPHRRRGTMITIMFCGFPIGAVVGGLVSSKAIPVYGWESVFIAGGVLPLLLVPALMIWLPESVRFLAAQIGGAKQASALLNRIDSHAVIGFSASPPRPTGPSTRAGIGALFAERQVAGTLLLWTAFFCNLLVLYFLINWLPSVLQRAGVSLERAILATALLNAGGVVGGLAFSWIIDRFGPRMVLTLAYLGAAVLVSAIGIEWNSAATTYGIIAAAGFCVIGAQFGMNALAAEYYPTSLRSTGVGAALGIGRVGAMMGPLVGGVLISLDLGTMRLFSIAAIPAVVAGLAIYLACRATAPNADETIERGQIPLTNLD
jgi:AAHS family 4-hydroxybenzoate transporter-like MFS transporter